MRKGPTVTQVRAGGEEALEVLKHSSLHAPAEDMVQQMDIS